MAKYQATAATSNAVRRMLENAALDSESFGCECRAIPGRQPAESKVRNKATPLRRPHKARRSHIPTLVACRSELSDRGVVAGRRNRSSERALRLDDPTTLMSQHNIFAAYEPAGSLAMTRMRG
jgi:hypothetical protein